MFNPFPFITLLSTIWTTNRNAKLCDKLLLQYQLGLNFIKYIVVLRLIYGLIEVNRTGKYNPDDRLTLPIHPK